MTLFSCVRISLKPRYASRKALLTQLCRSLYLLTETFGKQPPPGGSKITKLVPFNRFEDPEQCIIGLHGAHKSVQETTLSSVMQLNVNPGWALCAKQTFEFNEYPQCRMKLLISTALQTHALERMGKGAMKSRIFRFSSKTSNHTFVELMATMWYHLSKRQVVEVQVQYHRAEYKARSREGLTDPFKKLFAECIHLRPDVMLKAMPENCGIIISPQTDDSSVVSWAIGPPHIGKDGKVSEPRSRTRELYERREKAIKRLNTLEDQAFKDNAEELADSVWMEERFAEKGIPGSQERLNALKKGLQKKHQARKKLEQELQERALERKRKKNQVYLKDAR